MVQLQTLFEDLGAHAKSFQSPEGGKGFVVVCLDRDSSLMMWTTLDPLHYSPVNINGGLLGLPFSVVHRQLLCLAHIEGEVVVLAPHCQCSDHLSWATH